MCLRRHGIQEADSASCSVPSVILPQILKLTKLRLNFIRKKIQEIVKDPETARKLTPTGLYAKRPLCDNGYYDTFNRDNVSLVSVKENPIVEITPKGVRTTDGEYELDVLIYATGFDAVDGNYTKIDMRGRDGITMNEKWADGPTGYLGMMNTHFPNRVHDPWSKRSFYKLTA